MNPENQKSKSRIQAILIITGFVALSFAGYAFWSYPILSRDAGPVTSPDDWPDPLKALRDDPDRIEFDPSTLQVYCLCKGFDPEFVWRMDAAPGLFAYLKNRWRLTKIEHPNWYILKGYSQLSGAATPPWWSPKDDGDTQFFVCPQTLAGEKGNRFKVALDEKSRAIFVHYWFNF